MVTMTMKGTVGSKVGEDAKRKAWVSSQMNWWNAPSRKSRWSGSSPHGPCNRPVSVAASSLILIRMTFDAEGFSDGVSSHPTSNHEQSTVRPDGSVNITGLAPPNWYGFISCLDGSRFKKRP